MSCIFTKNRLKTYIMYLLSTLFVFLLFACGQGANNPRETSPDTCNISFDISWPESAREDTFLRLKLDCSRVPNIMASVYSDSGTFLREGGPWECTDGRGLITDVPSGGKAIVTIKGMNSNEDIIYRGESNVIDLVPGTVSAGTIEAHDFVPELISPADNSGAMIEECVFQWSERQGASEYWLQIAEDLAFTTILNDITVSELNNPSYDPDGNMPLGKCYWRVKTKDIYNKESGWSDEWSVTITVSHDNIPPTSPIDLVVDPNNWTNVNSFQINWTNPDDQTGISGAYYTLGSAPASQTDGNYTADKPFTVSATAEGGQAVYVWLKDGAGNTDPNNHSVGTILYDATPPIDGNITITEGDSHITLSWSGFSDGVSGINQYVLSCSTSGYPSLSDQNTIIYFGEDTSYSHTNLENGTTYYYRIFAQDNAVNTSLGVTTSGTPQPPQAIDYYVDAYNGNNTTGEGSQTNPWMTITHALSEVNGPEATINVAKGTYDTVMDGTCSEVFPIQLKDGVSLNGEDKHTTIIDAKMTNTLLSGTDIGSDTMIEGFTFRNGKYTGSGGPGGMVLTSSSPTIKDNIFENNEGWSQGTAISLYSASAPLIVNNIFQNNISELHGIIYVNSSSPTIGENFLTGNSAGVNFVEAVIYIASGTALIRNNIFANNNTYGAVTIAVGSNNSHIINNTIVGTNRDDTSGSGIIISGGTGTKIVNNIIADNTGYGIEEKEASYDPNIVEYNLFYNNKSGHYFDEGQSAYNTVLSMNGIIPECANNLEEDPLFIDQSYNDYHLQNTSAAINAGTNNNAPTIDMDGDTRPQDGIVDIGADETKLAPPENIIAFPADGRITITWDKVSAATAYKIYMADSPGVSKEDFDQEITVNTPYYTWTELTNGTTYYFVLTSENNDGEGSESNEIAAAPNTESNHYIFPDSGIDKAPTQVTIIGEGFQETPKAALYGGGLYIAGACDTPGGAWGVYVTDGYAFVADDDSGLQVIDISNPGNPTIMGTCDTPSYARGVYVTDDYAFVADYKSGLQIIDISTPGNPTIVGACDTPGTAMGVYVTGDYAFVADLFSGLQVIDISNPSNPVIVSTCDTPSYARGVYVTGDYAFVADDDSGLQIIDTSTPGNPVIVGTCDTPDEAHDVYVTGDYAFVADRDSGLQIIDTSTPGNPVIVGTCDTPDEAQGVYVTGDYAFVANWDSGLQVIDISTPGNPVIVGAHGTPGLADGVYITGEYAFVADRHSGLQVIDIITPGNPSILCSCDTPGYAYDVYVTGDYAYVADSSSGLQVIDITTLSNPTILSTCDTPSYANGVYVTGDYAFVADGDSGLQVIDISNPSNPAIVGACDTPDEAHDVYVTGDYAFVADRDSGLQVIDISTLSNPVIVSACDTPDYAMGVYVTGDYAYVANFSSGLQIIDTSTPSNPTIISACDTQFYAEGVYVTGDYAYVADFGSGLQIIDISIPSNPIIVGTCDTPGHAESVYVTGGYAYVADYGSGLQIIDISTPGNPCIVGACGTPSNAYGIYVTNGYAFVADKTSGLQVIEKIKLLTDITYLDPYMITATVPAGFSAGTYNLHITNPDGGHKVLNNAFTIYPLP